MTSEDPCSLQTPWNFRLDHSATHYHRFAWKAFLIYHYNSKLSSSSLEYTLPSYHHLYTMSCTCNPPLSFPRVLIKTPSPVDLTSNIHHRQSLVSDCLGYNPKKTWRHIAFWLLQQLLKNSSHFCTAPSQTLGHTFTFSIWIPSFLFPLLKRNPRFSRPALAVCLMVRGFQKCNTVDFSRPKKNIYL